MEKLKPNKQRAKTAIMMIWIVMVMELISIVSGYFQYDLLKSLDGGQDISMQQLTANDKREMIIGIVYLIIFIVSAVTFIMWFRRAYFNLHVKLNGLSYKEGWAAGVWFVPIMNLYGPYQIMDELYRETKKLLDKYGLGAGHSFSTQTVGWWWALLIISKFADQYVYKYIMRADSVDEYIFGTVTGIIVNIVGIPLALITVKVIKNYSVLESLLPEIKDEDETTDSAGA